MSPLSRRQFLSRGAGAGVAALFAPSLLAACGSSSGSLNLNTVNLDTVNLIQRFPKDVLTPGRVRLPISLAANDGVLTVGSGVKIPEILRFIVTDIDGNAIFDDDFPVQSHVTDVPQPYWPLVVNIKDTGMYFISLSGHDAAGAAFQVVSPNEVLMPTVGTVLPAFDTPTVSDPRGVNPVCTRTPSPCPLHDINLRDALALGKPVVYLVGTPAFCQTGTCTPALDALLSAHSDLRGKATFIHAEVYTNKTATTYAPAIDNYKMTFEPALFITNAQGVLVERLDAIFDKSEVREALGRNGIS